MTPRRSPADRDPVELGAVVTSIALHAGAFIQDIMTQYAQPRPWILLQEGGGNTYVSSAMPQKRNPGLLNDAQPGLARASPWASAASCRRTTSRPA
jgi:argininosuccinate lyase